MKFKYPLFVVGVIIALLGYACVDPIDFDIPPPEIQTVVEGFISDEEGPYTLKVSRGFSLDASEPESTPITDLRIELFDDQGNSEMYTEVMPGTYQTAGMIRGEVGRSYHIQIQTPEGDVFESEPDELRATGFMEDIKFQYRAGSVEEVFGIVPANVFEVLVDGNAGPEEESFTRWRYTGTYEVKTFPELYEEKIRTFRPFAKPFPCSGWEVFGCIGATKIRQIAPCECCTCWVNEFEKKPQLSDNLLVSNNEFRNVKVAEVPINPRTFYNKYLVEIEQMSMTRSAFEFFRLVRSQKEDASSFFQPTFGEIIGNIKSTNSEKNIIGFFWATSIDRRSEFVERTDIPYNITPIDTIKNRCYDFFPFATTEKPDGWD